MLFAAEEPLDDASAAGRDTASGAIPGTPTWMSITVLYLSNARHRGLYSPTLALPSTIINNTRAAAPAYRPRCNGPFSPESSPKLTASGVRQAAQQSECNASLSVSLLVRPWTTSRN